MTKTQAPVETRSTDASGSWTGWVVFASIMLVVVGAINIVQGLAALLDDTYFVARSDNLLLISDFTTWGVVLLVWGGAQVAAGAGLNFGQGWARVMAILIACVGVLIQIAFLAAFPLWSAIIIALDVIVIFALTARWQEARSGL